MNTQSGLTMAEQLDPFRRKLQQSYSTVRPVSESVLDLASHVQGTDQFVKLRDIVLQWIKNRSGRPLPVAALRGESFDLEEVGSQRTGAVALPSPRYWAARLDDSDREVPQRNWVTEIGIGETAQGRVIFGSRLLCVTRGFDAPFQPSIQSFVRQIVGNCQDITVDGRSIARSVTVVDSEDGVDDLVDLLNRKSRRLAVVVCALPEGSEEVGDSTVDADRLHRYTLGAAHLIVLTASASWFLSDRVGKEFSVFRGAVRSYRPGFDITSDEPFAHPLALPDRIRSWPNGGSQAYEDFLISKLLSSAATTQGSENRIPSFTLVRQLAAEQKLAAARDLGSSDEDLLALAEDEISELKQALEKDRTVYTGLVSQYERERDQAREELEQIQATNNHLRQRLEALQGRLKQASDRPIEQQLPNNLAGFEEWCREHLSGSVEVHNRAMQGVKNSLYVDTTLIYKSLLVLRDEYVPMRREGGLERKHQFETACANLGLAEEPTFSGARYGEQGDEYFVRYAGRRVLLDRHLKKGNGRDQRYCFRLYFFWDDDNEQAVVGWLPSHLDTRIT